MAEAVAGVGEGGVIHHQARLEEDRLRDPLEEEDRLSVLPAEEEAPHPDHLEEEDRPSVLPAEEEEARHSDRLEVEDIRYTREEAEELPLRDHRQEALPRQYLTHWIRMGPRGRAGGPILRRKSNRTSFRRGMGMVEKQYSILRRYRLGRG